MSLQLKFVLVAMFCALLSGCYIVPGQFDAQLDIRSDGTFTYRYSGEIVYLDRRTVSMQPWDDKEAVCFQSENRETRPCSPAEIEQKRARYETAQQDEMKENAAWAKLTGFNPQDEAANRRIAEEMVKQKGWKKASYKGDGVFEVEFEIGDRLERDFAFPTLPTAQMLIPFLIVRPGKDGLVTIEAPGMTGGIMRRVIEGNPQNWDQDAAAWFNRINGRLRISTDAKLISSNGQTFQEGENSYAEWQVIKAEVAGMEGKLPFAEVKLP